MRSPHRPCGRLAPGLMLLTAALVTLAAPASAKLMVSGPGVAAPLVIAGTVSEYVKTDELRRAVIHVDEVLKGEFRTETLVVERRSPVMYGWLGFDFPPPGGRVFLLLRAGDRGSPDLAWDLNSVALIEEEASDRPHVTGLAGGGSRINGHAPAEYVRAYDAFYQSRHASRPPSDTGPRQAETRIRPPSAQARPGDHEPPAWWQRAWRAVRTVWDRLAPG